VPGRFARWHHRGAGRAAARMLRGAARSTRARGASMAWYGLAIALGLLVGWIAVFLASRS
jgi:hypothetical protein